MPDEEMLDAGQGAPPKPRRLSIWGPQIGIAFLVIWAILQLTQPLPTTALTVWPAWVGCGLLLPLFLLNKAKRRLLFTLWLIPSLALTEDTIPVIRAAFPAATAEKTYRVVTLNCAGGMLAAALEVKPLRPDIIFFQESPNERELQNVARIVFRGEPSAIVRGPDAVILAKGELDPLQFDRIQGNFTAARWLGPEGERLNLVSLRLAPPVLRLDLYSPDAWRNFADSRELRKQEVDEMAADLKSANFTPDLIGGDWNTPPDPFSQSALTAGLTDAYLSTGRWLGATCVNPYPNIVRIDQIWGSPKVRFLNTWVVKTEFSDHRIVVSDFTLR